MPTADTLIRAAGAVLWRPDAGRLRIAVAHRPRYDDWSLPKGKLESGETAPAAAVREVLEETGFRAHLGRRLGQSSYVVEHSSARRTGPKVVDYWAARAVDGEFRPGDEVDQLRWLGPDEAAELLTHDADRSVLESFLAVPVPTATVLLVRHGKAGDRSKWRGEDDLRPLTAAGRRQATALRSLLGLFGPTRVHSAPLVRCTRTVEPLAAALGVPIVDEPLLSEDGYWADPATARDRFLRLADSPGRSAPAGRDGAGGRGGAGATGVGSGGNGSGVDRSDHGAEDADGHGADGVGDDAGFGGAIVVCSQGDVIPDLVHELAGAAAADDDGTIPAKKASTWVLSLRRRRLLAADYYGPP